MHETLNVKKNGRPSDGTCHNNNNRLGPYRMIRSDFVETRFKSGATRTRPRDSSRASRQLNPEFKPTWPYYTWYLIPTNGVGVKWAILAAGQPQPCLVRQGLGPAWPKDMSLVVQYWPVPVGSFHDNSNL